MSACLPLCHDGDLCHVSACLLLGHDNICLTQFIGFSWLICLPIHPPTRSSIYPSMYPSTCPSVLQSFLTSSFPSIYPSLSSSHSPKFSIVILRSLNCIYFVCTYVLALHSMGHMWRSDYNLQELGFFHHPFLGFELRSYVLGGIFFLTEPSRWPLLTLICRREVTNLWNGLSFADKPWVSKRSL